MQILDPETLLALTTFIEMPNPAVVRPFSHRFIRRLINAGALSEGRYIRKGIQLDDKTEDRIQILLKNRTAAKELIERYRRKGFSICVPSDPEWPQSLSALGASEPVFLFTSGNRALFQGRHISVAGSRDIGAHASEAAREAGESIAAHGCILVSGNARGTDRICQEAAMRAGGRMILFPASRADIRKQDPLICAHYESGNLLIATETLPDEPFSAAKALSRNHMIYAMGDPAVVIAARTGMGGSWHGAVDCLKHGWSTVLAVTGEQKDYAGCRALLSRGAHPVDPKPGKIWDQIESYKRLERNHRENPVQLVWEMQSG